MKKIDLDEANEWIAGVVGLHPRDLVKAVTQHYQVGRDSASAMVKQCELAGLISRSGPPSRPLFVPSENLTLMQSYSLPLDAVEKIWQQDFATALTDGLLPAQQQLLHLAFVTLAGHASAHSRGKALHIIAERQPNHLEMTFQDNGVGLFREIAAQGLDDQAATKLVELQMQLPAHRPVTSLVAQFDYVQIEANGLHFPKEQAPAALDSDDEEELYEQGTTVVLGLTLNHDINH